MGQDSVHSTLPRNGEISDSAPSTEQISPARPRKGDVAASAPDQAKDTQITLAGSGEDLPTTANESGEAKRIAQTSAPDTQEANKFVPSGQISPAEPKNKEIRDSAPSTRLISSTDTRKEDSVIAAPDQGKDSQTTIDQQDMLSAPVRSASPSSDTQSPSEKAREDAPADDLGDDASKSLALDREVRPRTVVPASSPATFLGAAPDETAHNGKVLEPSGQDSALQPSFSSELTKDDTIVMAADQTKDPQTMIHQQNVTPATDTEKTPLSGTKYSSRKSQESTSDDIDSNESVPGEEQVSLGQRDSHRREGHATKPYGITIDEKTTTSSSKKTFSLESGSDLTRAHSDVHPSTGEGPTTTSLHEHGLQTQPPLATQSISLDTSSKAKSTGREANTPVAAASETQPGSTQAQDETAPVEQNFSVSDQESAHASKSLSAAGPRKGEKYVFGPTDQKNVPHTILGNQATRKTPHAREGLSEFQESSHDDDHIRNLVSPLISQEQASHAQRPSEGPTSEAHSAFVDKKTTLPSSQAQTSNTEPDSTPITGDAHLINADMPATSNSQNQEAQSPAAAQAPTTQALQGSASSQNVHDVSLQNMETPRKPSKDEVMAPVTHSAAYSDAPNSEPGTATVQPPQKVAFDLSGGEKTTATQDDQVNTLPNGDLPSSQQVGTSESTDFNGTNSEQKLEGASTYDKSKAQHQNDQFDTPSYKGNSKVANEAIISDLSTPLGNSKNNLHGPRKAWNRVENRSTKNRLTKLLFNHQIIT